MWLLKSESYSVNREQLYFALCGWLIYVSYKFGKRVCSACLLEHSQPAFSSSNKLFSNGHKIQAICACLVNMKYHERLRRCCVIDVLRYVLTRLRAEKERCEVALVAGRSITSIH